MILSPGCSRAVGKAHRENSHASPWDQEPRFSSDAVGVAVCSSATATSLPGYGLADPDHGLTSWLDPGPAPSPRTCLLSCTLGCTWLPSQGQRERALADLQHPLLSQPCSGPAADIADPNWQRLPRPSEGCKHAPLAVPPDTSRAAGLGKRHDLVRFRAFPSGPWSLLYLSAALAR